MSRTVLILVLLGTVFGLGSSMRPQASAVDVSSETARPISPKSRRVVSSAPFDLVWSEGSDAIKYQVLLTGGRYPSTIGWRSLPLSALSYTVPEDQFVFADGALYSWRVRECYDTTCTYTSDWSEVAEFFWRRNFHCAPTLTSPEDGVVIESMPIVFRWLPCNEFEIEGSQIEDEGSPTFNISIQGPGIDLNEYITRGDYVYVLDGYDLENGASYEWKMRQCYVPNAGDYSCAFWSETRTFTWQHTWNDAELWYNK